MMKMSGRVTVYYVALLLTLTPVSAVQKIDSIKELKKIYFGQSVPEHSLVLLYWFANTIETLSNATWLIFDPENGDYGSNHYGNYEGLLDPLPQGHQYYTIGHIYQDSSAELPSYVVNHRKAGMGRNTGLIIIRIKMLNTGRRAQRIDQVYITQHYGTGHKGTSYDPQHTYGISSNLLKNIREFSVGSNQKLLTSLRDRYASNTDDFELNYIRNIWGNLAGLELLLLIVMQKEHYDLLNYRPQNRLNRWKANALQNCCMLLLLILILIIILPILITVT